VHAPVIRSYHLTEDADVCQVTEECDLGIVFTSDLMFERHISIVVKRANSILGVIKHNFDLGNYQMFRILYTTLVRSHLEYGCAVWSPYLTRDIKAIEAVQRLATKLPTALKSSSYGDRLNL